MESLLYFIPLTRTSVRDMLSCPVLDLGLQFAIVLQSVWEQVNHQGMQIAQGWERILPTSVAGLTPSWLR